MHRLAVGAVFIFTVTLLPGCGDGKAAVEGTVSLDGESVKSGTIEFIPVEKGGRPEGGPIVDGTFKTRMLPGTYVISLTGSRKTGTRTQKGFDGKDEVIDLFEPIFPPQFNVNSDIKKVIEPGANTITLDLKSKK